MRSHPFALFLAASLTAAASADTISLQAARDNTIFQGSNGNSNGAGPNLFAGRNTQNNTRRALLAFDLSLIPAGATITGASLTLTASQTQGPATDVTLHRTLANWGEAGSSSTGGQGAPAQPGDATWTHSFFNTIMWTTEGGDFAATPSATQSVSGVGVYTWSSPGLLSDVQSWLDAPAANFGWTIRGVESAGGTAKRFDSRENDTVANRPVLNVEYSIPAPACAAFVVPVLTLASRRRR